MDINKVNTSLSTTKKIENINDMVIEVDGKVSKGQFNKNEITQIISDTAIDRKYLRDQSIGHTLSTYSGWTHLYAESGYSIWKFSPTSYKYNALNELYLDNKLVENRLQANSEIVSSFDKVFLYNGDSASGYTDDTTEAGTEDGVSFEVMDSSEDYLYVGLSTTFAGVSFEWDVRGSNYTLELEYWNGNAWTDLDISGATFVDDTSNFESDGRIYWDIPSNWATTTVNSVASKYWVRMSTTTEPTTTGKAYLIQPANSVIDMLKLSSSEILNEEWAWCTYGTVIYVTIRNSGQSAYEGNAYITSSSTSINKQNYFIHNHEFTANYQDSTYASTSIYGYYLAPIKDKDLTSPPANPVLGDRYLIIDGDSGTWYGHDNEVAEFNSSSGWDFTSPLGGMVTYAIDDEVWYSYDGTNWGAGFNSSGYSGWSGFSGQSGWSGYSGKADEYNTTSTSTLTITNTGTINLTVGTGLAYIPAQDVVIAYDVNNNMDGEIISYNINSGAMSISITGSDGSGEYSSWSINLSGAFGLSGYSGWSGISGWSGWSGYSGWSGFSGDSGYSGLSGIGTSGYSGWSGFSGIGTSGYSGAVGPAPTAKGEWSSLTTYSINDLVSYGAATWISLQNTNLNNTPVEGSYWSLFAEQGVSGYSGYSGWSGISGDSGYSGYSGKSGYSGWSGTSGYSGLLTSGTDATVGNLTINGVAYFDIEYNNGNSGSTKTIDWSNGNKQKITLNATPVYLTFTDFVPSASNPACNLILKLIQDGTGSRTVIFPANVKWSGGTAPTLTTTASRVDLISLYFDGTLYFGVSSLNYSV